MANDLLPLFPLRLVLLPGEILPLHIFENRYKEMIEECRETKRPFGIVLAAESGFRSAGCTARLTEVTEEFPDGRMNIMTRGEERFRILRIHRDHSYLTAEAEYFDDQPEDSTESRPSIALTEKIIAAILDKLEDADLISDEIRRDPKKLSFLAGAVLGLSVREKQILLESESARERLNILAGIFAGRSGHFQKKDALRNGHPRR
ncbi:MAG: LON peptidase substrate-binding domain-containing protein [Nitrospinota bacterium]